MELHISIDGFDGNDGSIESPLGTLDGARKAIRNSDRLGKEAMTVYLRAGVYYLDKTFRLTPEDSGTADAPVEYRALNEESVTLSGGIRLDCSWRPYRDGILMCSTPAGLEFDQLFADGKRQVLARYPNREVSDTDRYAGYIHATDAIADDVVDPFPDPDGDMTYPSQPKRGICFDPTTFTSRRWDKPVQARLHIYQSYYWGNLQWDIKHIEWDAHRIWFGDGGHQLGAQFSHSPANVDGRSRFFVENVFEELDAPGEWYHDRESAILYWMPPEGIDPQCALIEVPQLKQVIDFQGCQKSPIHHISFQRLRSTGTATTYMDPYEIPSLGDWALVRSGAVLMEGTRNCAVRDCWFDAVGGNAVFINRYNRDVEVSGCTFSHTGDSAVCLVGEYESTTGTQKPFPYECRVVNNHVHHCGEYGKQVAGVYISRAKRITVAHNLIHDMSRAGICIGDGTWGGHVIEDNHVHDTCQQTDDHGPFNSWGRERYWSLIHSHFETTDQNYSVTGDVLFDAMEPTVIRHNYFVDHKGWGIDLDDGSSNYEVVNNLCVGISVKLREGGYRTVHNNIWVNPANPPSLHLPNIDNHDRYFHNITVMRPDTIKVEHDFDFRNEVSGNEIYAVSRPPVVGPWFEEIDRNCFFNQLGEFSMRLRLPVEGQRLFALEEWQAHGFDRNSVFGDPLFLDPENDDYRVSPDSPALKVGFKNFEMSGWGLNDEFRHW